MVSVTIPRVGAAGAVIAAILLVQLARAPSDESSSAPFEVSPLPAREEPAPLVVADAAVAPSQGPATAKQRELEAMSETFRNSTFLIAIRDAGFVCDQLLRVIGGLDDSPKWLASCSEMLSYTVAVASDGTLRIEPFLQYSDGIGVRTIEREFEPPPEPQPLPR